MSSWAMNWEYSFTSGIGVWFLVPSLLCRATVPQVLVSSWCGFTLIIAPWCLCYSKALSFSSAKNYSLFFLICPSKECWDEPVFSCLFGTEGVPMQICFGLPCTIVCWPAALKMARLGWCCGLHSVSSQKSWHPLWCFRADPTCSHNTKSELIPISQSGTGSEELRVVLKS